MPSLFRTCCCFLVIFCTLQATAQPVIDSGGPVTPGMIDAYRKELFNKADVTEFYAGMNNNLAWIGSNRMANLQQFIMLVDQSVPWALTKNDYRPAYLLSIKNNSGSLQTLQDSIAADIAVTDIAIHFFSDLAYGKKPALGYDGISYTPHCYPVGTKLAESVKTQSLNQWAVSLNSSFPGLQALIAKLEWLQTILAAPDFKNVKAESKPAGKQNHNLLIKLYQLGLISKPATDISDTALVAAIKAAQRMFCLLDDATLRSTFIAELNRSVQYRAQQLALSINYYRWLRCLPADQQVIVVNIPAAEMNVYLHDSVVLHMRMVVGKSSTPTPTFSSIADQVILYPYWHVPNKIAVNELLPAIKRNPAYLDQGGYQLMDKSGRIVNPHTVNWRKINRRNFPYLIRQSTGCDNALGLIKVNFYSPFGVYLHDTPTKISFSLNKRYFSHGCMRMEKPMELGRRLLDGNTIAIDTLEQKGCLLHQSPVIVPAIVKMPVIVWYNPAGTNDRNQVVFYEDIYEKFNWQ
ncbi:MAG: L,D-transpeptidase family protein [Bacteroidetes bacterium]|nr:L,D-transpeptidase family protein [Bacteroidota bacterium]